MWKNSDFRGKKTKTSKLADFNQSWWFSAIPEISPH